MLQQQQQIDQGARMAKDENFLSVPTAARRLSCTLRWVYDMVYAGRLKAEKVAGRWRIPVAEIEALLKQRGK
jgi:excisionase family DNA binding protein